MSAPPLHPARPAPHSNRRKRGRIRFLEKPSACAYFPFRGERSGGLRNLSPSPRPSPLKGEGERDHRRLAPPAVRNPARCVTLISCCLQQSRYDPFSAILGFLPRAPLRVAAKSRGGDPSGGGRLSDFLLSPGGRDIKNSPLPRWGERARMRGRRTAARVLGACEDASAGETFPGRDAFCPKQFAEVPYKKTDPLRAGVGRRGTTPGQRGAAPTLGGSTGEPAGRMRLGTRCIPSEAIYFTLTPTLSRQGRGRKVRRRSGTRRSDGASGRGMLIQRWRGGRRRSNCRRRRPVRPGREAHPPPSLPPSRGATRPEARRRWCRRPAPQR